MNKATEKTPTSILLIVVLVVILMLVLLIGMFVIERLSVSMRDAIYVEHCRADFANCNCGEYARILKGGVFVDQEEFHYGVCKDNAEMVR